MANEIIKVLDALCEKFGIAVDWTSDNVLPYVQELCGKYINYEIWTSVGWIALFSILFIVCLVAAVKIYSKAKKEGWNDEFITGMCIAVPAIVGLMWLCTMVAQIGDIITCLTFPEKMIFEYVHGMLPSSN